MAFNTPVTTTPIRILHERVARALGENVRRLRKAKGWTQMDLWAMSHHGVSKNRIIQIERGETNPGLRLIVALARALGVSVGELFDLPEDGLTPERVAALSRDIAAVAQAMRQSAMALQSEARRCEEVHASSDGAAWAMQAEAGVRQSNACEVEVAAAILDEWAMKIVKARKQE